jgi:hypothetical protein
MSCLKENYSSQDFGELNANLFGKYNNIEELIKNIK